MTRLEKIASLYSALAGDVDITSSEINDYAGLADSVTLEAISATLTNGSILDFSALPTDDLLDYMFINLFGYSQDDVDALRATEAGAAGFAYWEDELANNADVINVNTLAIALLNGAGETDAAAAAAKVADVVTAYEADYADVTPEVPGSTISLTSGTDRGGEFDGTDGNDEFVAYLQQNGGVTNSLSSADKLDGGAGTDTLYAELVPEFFGSTGDNQIDVQARTADIEEVTFEARDSGSNDTETIYTDGAFAEVNANSVITVDAKYMTGLDSIGSYMSDGDLVIENLTTLTDAGVARNTEDLTITMDHTDNMNSDEDASDLTVYLDEDYLLAGQTKTASQANYWLLDEESEDYVTQPLLNIERDGVTLTIDGTEYTIAMESDVASAADTWAQFAAGLQAVIDASAEPAFEGLTVVVDETNTDSTFNDAGDNVTIPAITIIDSQGRSLVPTGFVSPADATGAFDIYGDYDNVASEAVNQKVTINVELEKVGREGDGGDLIIGGKELDNEAVNGNNVTTGNGIDTFNISVLGDESKLSNLGSITSTNNALKTVNISTADTTLDDFASLTVRDSFGGTLDRLDADAFLGDLDIGQDVAAANIDAFTATGGGDVTLVETLSVAASVVTGAGMDDLTITNATTGSVALNSGSNDDTITLNLTTSTGNTVAAGLGDDTVVLTGTGEAMVDGGSGEDTITAAVGVAVEIDGGVGSDTIYTDNSGVKETFTLDTSGLTGLLPTATIPSSDGVSNATIGDGVEFLYNTRLQVTLNTSNVASTAFTSGFESELITITPDTGYLTSQDDINTAIMTAINDNEVLNKIATATVDANGDVVVSYLVDGAQNTAGVEVEFFAAAVPLTASLQSLIEAEFMDVNNDSDAFNATDALTEQATALAALQIGGADLASTGDGNGTDSTAATANVVNGGSSDDFIVLSSDSTAAASADTIVYTGYNQGMDTVVHFDTLTDKIDLSAYLTNTVTNSGSSVSQVDMIEVTGVGYSFEANSITVSSLTALANADTAGDADDFGNLTAADVEALLEAAASGATTSVTSNTDALFQNTAVSILILENDEANGVGATGNLGEYKIFEVSYTDANLGAGATDFTVKLIGGIDVGDNLFIAEGDIIA